MALLNVEVGILSEFSRYTGSGAVLSLDKSRQSNQAAFCTCNIKVENYSLNHIDCKLCILNASHQGAVKTKVPNTFIALNSSLIIHHWPLTK